MKINLLPLDEQAARTMAAKRGMTIEAYFTSLIREEAAIEITNWRGTPQHDTPMPAHSTAEPTPQAAQHG